MQIANDQHKPHLERDKGLRDHDEDHNPRLLAYLLQAPVVTIARMTPADLAEIQANTNGLCEYS